MNHLKEKGRNIYNNIKWKAKYGYYVLFGIIICSYNAKVAYAGDLEGSKMVTGTTKLLKDAMTVLQVMAPSVGAVMLIWNGIKLINADEQEAKPVKKRMVVILVAVLITILAATIIKTITTYYGKTPDISDK